MADNYWWAKMKSWIWSRISGVDTIEDYTDIAVSWVSKSLHSKRAYYFFYKWLWQTLVTQYLHHALMDFLWGFLLQEERLHDGKFYTFQGHCSVSNLKHWKIYTRIPHGHFAIYIYIISHLIEKGHRHVPKILILNIFFIMIPSGQRLTNIK